jgi:hypothetical protein
LYLAQFIEAKRGCDISIEPSDWCVTTAVMDLNWQMAVGKKRAGQRDIKRESSIYRANFSFHPRFAKPKLVRFTGACGSNLWTG